MGKQVENQSGPQIDRRVARIIVWVVIVAACYFLAHMGIEKAFTLGTLGFLGLCACGLVP